MIATARQMPEDQKLSIVSLGAVTNVASALALAPEIIPKVRCYCLGGRYHPDQQVWNKDEFNVRNDLNAMNYLFDLEDLELHVMPITVLMDFKFNQQETLDKLRGERTGMGLLSHPVAHQWSGHSGTYLLGLSTGVEAVVQPSLATEQSLTPPPENKQRPIQVYTAVDAPAMIRDWWQTVEKAMGND